MWRAAPGWSGNVCATIAQLGRLRNVYRSSVAQYALPGGTPGAACPRASSYSQGLPG